MLTKGANRRPPRLLFGSYSCLLDPSNGAAISVQHLLKMLADRGWQGQVVCGPQMTFEEAPPLEQLLEEQDISLETSSDNAGNRVYRLLHAPTGGVPVTVYAPPATCYPEPGRAEGDSFLSLYEQVLDDFQPDLVLTYGHHWLGREMIASARRRGVPAVYYLSTRSYAEAEQFRGVDGILVPSRFLRAYYRRSLGLACTAIPDPMDWSRVQCPEMQRQYVTFVNPQRYKGALWVARLAQELGARRPDIPFLIVEGRGQVEWLQDFVDFRRLTNVYVADYTPDPRDFFALSRVVLMPSLCAEAAGRVAVEALINGIPVLASRRGGLPETLAQAGFLFDVPECYTPAADLVPTAAEVAPWLETIVRLWDDAAFYEEQRRRCHRAAEAWRPERLAPLYEQFLAGMITS